MLGSWVRKGKEGGRCDVPRSFCRAGGRGSITQGGSLMVVLKVF